MLKQKKGHLSPDCLHTPLDCCPKDRITAPDDENLYESNLNQNRADLPAYKSASSRNMSTLHP